jgi:hypothetical protein
LSSKADHYQAKAAECEQKAKQAHEPCRASAPVVLTRRTGRTAGCSKRRVGRAEAGLRKNSQYSPPVAAPAGRPIPPLPRLPRGLGIPVATAATAAPPLMMSRPWPRTRPLGPPVGPRSPCRGTSAEALRNCIPRDSRRKAWIGIQGFPEQTPSGIFLPTEPQPPAGVLLSEPVLSEPGPRNADIRFRALRHSEAGNALGACSSPRLPREASS